MEITYVHPHLIVSEEVNDTNQEVFLASAEEIFKLSRQAHGIHKSAYAIAHSQVEGTSPLRFFVTYQGDVFINPKITRHTKVPIAKHEGCMSFPTTPPASVMRFNKIEVEYQYFNIGMPKPWVISDVIKESVKGLAAQVFQHEVDHMDAKYVHQLPL